jgi:hypothetical protein
MKGTRGHICRHIGIWLPDGIKAIAEHNPWRIDIFPGLSEV